MYIIDNKSRLGRGVSREKLTVPDEKGKLVRFNSIRVDVMVPIQMDAIISDFSIALNIEKAAIVRMLIWLALRFSKPIELTGITNYEGKKDAKQNPQNPRKN